MVLWITLCIVVLLAIVVAVFLNLPQFGRLPDGDRYVRVQRSPNWKNGGFGSLSSGPIVRSMLEAYFHVGEYAEGAPKDKDKNGKDKNTKADKNTHDGKGDSQHDSDDR